MNDLPNDLISTGKAAKLLGLNPATICRWILSGRLRGWKVGGHYRVSRGEIQAIAVPVDRPPPRRLTRRSNSAHERAEKVLREAGIW